MPEEITNGPPAAQTKDVAGRIVKRYERAKKIWDLWQPVWQECYDYALPNREGFHERSPGTRNLQIYDETAPVTVQEFASKVAQTMVPNYMRWCDLKAGRAVPARARPEIDRDLQEVNEYVFEIIHNSNFAEEAHEALVECSIGTGTLLIEDAGPNQIIRTSAVPLTDVVLERGPFDTIDGHYRVRKVKGRDVEVIWPNAVVPAELAREIRQNGDGEHEFLEATWRDRRFTTEEVYRYALVWKKAPELMEARSWRGLGSCPWISFRWSKDAGSVYGRGPVLNALPAIKTANLTIELILQNAEMAITGMWQAEDDGVINTETIELLPGGIIPHAAGSQGLRPLETPGRFDVAQIVLEDMRANIKRALYADQFAPLDKTPMSATEVVLRQQDLAQRIGASYGRLQSELVAPVIRRAVWILREQGRIEIPRVDGREVAVVPISPLARAQRSEDILAIDRYLEQMSVRFGPEMTNLAIDVNQAADVLADLHQVPKKIVRSELDRQQLIAQMQQIAQAMPQAAA